MQEATFAAADGPFVRYRADLVVPEQTRVEMAVLKGIAAHYVMQADDRVALMIRQRELVSELVEALLAHAPASLDRPFADDWDAAPRRRRPAAGRRSTRSPRSPTPARSPGTTGWCGRAAASRTGWRA